MNGRRDKPESGGERPHDGGAAAEIRRVTLWGAAVNIVLSAVKFAAGMAASSQALVADAVHSLSDLLSDAAIVVGVKYWEQPADAGHPYGHGKIEGAVAALVGILIAGAAVEICWEGVKAISSGAAGLPGKAAFIAALFSIAAKEVLFRWTRAVAARRNSPALLANAWHHRSDAISSIPVAATVAIARFFPSLRWLDAAGAILVGGFVLRAAWQIIKPAFLGLTDASSGAAEAEIRAIALRVDGVLGVHNIRTRRYGGCIQADLHVQVDRNSSLVAAHAIGHGVKAALLDAGLGVTDATIHVEPAAEEHSDDPA